MNTVMIRHLVVKDWSFQRLPIAAACLAGLASLALLFSNSRACYWAPCC